MPREESPKRSAHCVDPFLVQCRNDVIQPQTRLLGDKSKGPAPRETLIPQLTEGEPGNNKGPSFRQGLQPDGNGVSPITACSCEAPMKARFVKKCGVAAKHDGYDTFGRRKGFP
jgi:hypothetical protein